MPVVKMLKSHADKGCVLFGGRYYNIQDKELFARLSADQLGPAFQLVKVVPKGVKVWGVELPDPEDEKHQHQNNADVEPETPDDSVELGKGANRRK